MPGPWRQRAGAACGPYFLEAARHGGIGARARRCGAPSSSSRRAGAGDVTAGLARPSRGGGRGAGGYRGDLRAGAARDGALRRAPPPSRAQRGARGAPTPRSGCFAQVGTRGRASGGVACSEDGDAFVMVLCVLRSRCNRVTRAAVRRASCRRFQCNGDAAGCEQPGAVYVAIGAHWRARVRTVCARAHMCIWACVCARERCNVSRACAQCTCVCVDVFVCVCVRARARACRCAPMLPRSERRRKRMSARRGRVVARRRGTRDTLRRRTWR